MSWKASARHGVREAPAGLALIQDLLNTRATMAYAPDLFADPDAAQSWLSDALAAWSRVAALPAPVLLLSSADLRSLRRLRATFEGIVQAGSRGAGHVSAGGPGAGHVSAGGHGPGPESAGGHGAGLDGAGGRAAGHDAVLPPADVPVTLVPDAAGWVRIVPAGRGTRWLASALWAEALTAQQAGLWPRLKLCHNVECRAAFFDTSRNNSGVWHDVSTCGNTANLRAFRERRRLMGESGGRHHA